MKHPPNPPMGETGQLLYMQIVEYSVATFCHCGKRVYSCVKKKKASSGNACVRDLGGGGQQ